MENCNNIALTLREVCEKFGIRGEMIDHYQITNGHINLTYYAKYRLEDGTEHEYVAQRINVYVFKKPELVMSNIGMVTEFMQDVCKKQGVDAARMAMHFYSTDEGKNYYVKAEGEVWRLCDYITDCETINFTTEASLLREAGEAFGDFQNALSDFDATLLNETIPDFHNTVKRFEHFFASVAADEYGRAKEVAEEIAFFESVSERCAVLCRQLDAGILPLRVTHNDTKINNVLFDMHDHSRLSVIDLDTVMPGLSAYDFGDAIRFAANTAAEDEPDLSKVAVNLELYEAFARGYISMVAKSMSEAEIKSMPHGALIMTTECAIRFLDDYLCGDKYFHTKYEGHNLVRCRCQIALAKSMIENFDRMEKIVSDIYNEMK